MFTDQEKLRAAERELALRKRVYPNRVLTHRMRKEQAEREIAIMAEIAADYRAKCELPL